MNASSFSHRGALVEPRKQGVYQPSKGDYPVRYGERAVVTTPELTMELDGAGRLKTLAGRSESWTHQLEYLKRTEGNDWVFYSLGEYSDYFGLYGEYYLPCPDYPTNRPLGGEPFRKEAVKRVFRAGSEAIRELAGGGERLPRRQRRFLEQLEANDPARLALHAQRLHEIIGSKIPVLPPDARHVDYDVVPLTVVDGCRYGCRFCCVDDGRSLSPRTRANLREQLDGLQRWLGRQAGNIQGLFLGLHDALAADDDLLQWTVHEAYRELGFEGSRFKWPQLYMFASVDSLLEKNEGFFDWLEEIPFSTFINVGLESPDPTVLQRLGKPLSPTKVNACFQRMVEINARQAKVEMTANFVLLPEMAERADDAIAGLLEQHLVKPTSRGVCYLSPLMEGPRRPRAQRRALIRRIHDLQRASPLQMYLYLIQRL